MSEETVKRFIDALQALESPRNVDPLVELVAEGAEIANVNVILGDEAGRRARLMDATADGLTGAQKRSVRAPYRLWAASPPGRRAGPGTR